MSSGSDRAGMERGARALSSIYNPGQLVGLIVWTEWNEMRVVGVWCGVVLGCDGRNVVPEEELIAARTIIHAENSPHSSYFFQIIIVLTLYTERHLYGNHFQQGWF